MDVEQIKRKYRRNVRFYDAIVKFSGRIRRQAVDRLALREGASVLDFGSGTGLSFELLEEAVGPKGRIVGVELSPEMIARARQKAGEHGWKNITIIESNAETVDLEPESVDAVLCFYTHDIMNSRMALERALKALRPGGTFVAAGVKRARGVAGAFINAITFLYSKPFVENFSNTEHPYANLEELLGKLEIEENLLGSAYIARGIKK